jgi:methyl-accepting chemotaxis protein
MQIRPKVLLAFVVPTAVTLVVGAIVFATLTNSLDASKRVDHSQQVISEAHLVLEAAIDAETGERGFVITRAESFLAPYAQGNTTFQQATGDLRTLVAGEPPQVARVAQMIQLHQQWIAQAAGPEIAAARSAGPSTAARLISGGTGKRLIDQQRAVVAGFVQAEQSLLRSRTAANNAASRRARVFLAVGLGLVVLLELAIGLWLSNRLSGSAQAVTRAARKLADGDTAVRAEVRSSDEIGELAGAFNEMAERLVEAAASERVSKEALQHAVRDYSDFAGKVAEGDLTAIVSANSNDELRSLSENLNGMVTGLAEISGQVREGGQSISSSTSEILAAVSQHTQSASQQSAAINETSTTVDEVRAASEQSAQKASEVAEQAERSVQVSDEGTQAVEAIAGAMEQIRERVEAIASDILALSERTQQIGEITGSVNDLAEQSNLLALNASIEAAKAGEHGRGFAVVATEVRNLAEQSKAATAQVSRILADIQNATSAAVLATEQGTKVVEEGLELSGRADERIRSLAGTIREASHAAQQIAASAHQQSIGMDQISQAMTDVSDSTAQFVAGARQSQQAAEDLNDLSGKLVALTDRYRV